MDCNLTLDSIIATDFNGDPNFMGFLSQIRQNILDAMANSDGKFFKIPVFVCIELGFS